MKAVRFYGPRNEDLGVLGWDGRSWVGTLDQKRASSILDFSANGPGDTGRVDSSDPNKFLDNLSFFFRSAYLRASAPFDYGGEAGAKSKGGPQQVRKTDTDWTPTYAPKIPDPKPKPVAPPKPQTPPPQQTQAKPQNNLPKPAGGKHLDLNDPPGTPKTPTPRESRGGVYDRPEDFYADLEAGAKPAEKPNPRREPVELPEAPAPKKKPKVRDAERVPDDEAYFHDLDNEDTPTAERVPTAKPARDKPAANAKLRNRLPKPTDGGPMWATPLDAEDEFGDVWAQEVPNETALDRGSALDRGPFPTGGGDKKRSNRYGTPASRGSALDRGPFPTDAPAKPKPRTLSDEEVADVFGMGGDHELASEKPADPAGAEFGREQAAAKQRPDGSKPDPLSGKPPRDEQAQEILRNEARRMGVPAADLKHFAEGMDAAKTPAEKRKVIETLRELFGEKKTPKKPGPVDNPEPTGDQGRTTSGKDAGHDAAMVKPAGRDAPKPYDLKADGQAAKRAATNLQVPDSYRSPFIDGYLGARKQGKTKEDALKAGMADVDKARKRLGEGNGDVGAKSAGPVRTTDRSFKLASDRADEMGLSDDVADLFVEPYQRVIDSGGSAEDAEKAGRAALAKLKKKSFFRAAVRKSAPEDAEDFYVPTSRNSPFAPPSARPLSRLRPSPEREPYGEPPPHSIGTEEDLREPAPTESVSPSSPSSPSPSGEAARKPKDKHGGKREPSLIPPLVEPVKLPGEKKPKEEAKPKAEEVEPKEKQKFRPPAKQTPPPSYEYSGVDSLGRVWEKGLRTGEIIEDGLPPDFQYKYDPKRKMNGRPDPVSEWDVAFWKDRYDAASAIDRRKMLEHFGVDLKGGGNASPATFHRVVAQIAASSVPGNDHVARAIRADESVLSAVDGIASMKTAQTVTLINITQMQEYVDFQESMMKEFPEAFADPLYDIEDMEPAKREGFRSMSKRLGELGERVKSAREEREDFNTRRGHELRQLLRIDGAHRVMFGNVGPDLKPGDTIPYSRAEKYLANMVAFRDGDGSFPEFDLERTDDRAHYSPHRHTINVGDGTGGAEVAVHEIGHALEEKLPGAKEAVQEFLKYRVGDEKPVRMDSLPGAELYKYEPHELGRKDKFESATGDNIRAHYVGRDYGGMASEVLSMGLQLLYADPASFARKDPEWCALVVGVLNGSLRKKR